MKGWKKKNTEESGEWERNGKGCVWGVDLHLKRLVIPEFFIIELLTSLQLLYRGQGGYGPSAEHNGGVGELLEQVRRIFLQARGLFLAQAHSLLINPAGMEIDTYPAGGVISFGLLIVLPLEMAYKDLCSPSGARFLRLVRPPVLSVWGSLVHMFTTWL